MRLPYEPQAVAHLLAKSADRGADGKPESLAAHTWAVVEKVANLIRLRPDLPALLGEPRLWHLLYWAAFIHDFGKAARGFQARLASRDAPRWPYRHEVLSLAFVEWVTEGLSQREAEALAAAVVAHHKDFATIAAAYPAVAREEESEGERLFRAEMDEPTIRALYRWLAAEGSAWREALALTAHGIELPALPPEEEAVAATLQSGGRRIRQWLRRYSRLQESIEPHGERRWMHVLLVLRGMLINADHLGSGHYGALPEVVWDVGSILSSRTLRWEALHDHQRAAVVEGSALLEAPTGSGKTEAALLWAACQARRRLFYTLPFQASMNAMRLRLVKSFGEEAVGIQHGRSLLALYRQKLQEDLTPHEAARAARIARDLARLNAPPIRLFSPYQMLKAPYKLRGYEAQLSDYFHAAFIFDEIHAYEVARLAMILETIRYLSQHLAARFFVMSATFPRLVKQRLEAALGALPTIRATPELYRRFQRHRLLLRDGSIGDPANRAAIFDAVQQGRAVLAVCNTVKGAQELFKAAGAAVPEARRLLLHGRFNGEDRLDREREIRELTDAALPERQPLLLIATQAVEVSLDISLDILFSEPAPLEALVQRFGRINRRGQATALAPVIVFREPRDGQKIYDAALVQATLTILEREAGKAVDEAQVGQWLDEIYTGEIEAAWNAAFEAESRTFRRLVERMTPYQSDKALEEQFYSAFDGIEVLPEGLWDAYQARLAHEPIRARELLVTIRWGQWKMLQHRGLTLAYEDGDGMPRIVTVPYSNELGLDLSSEPRVDQED